MIATPAGAYKFALNPIHWFATRDGWLDPTIGPDPIELMRLVAAAGFPAIHAQIPQGWSPSQYKQALSDNGLVPAPGYLALGLEEHGISETEALEITRRMAGDHAALGMTDMFLSTRMAKDAPRVLHPAIGYVFDEKRFETVLSLIDKASAVIGREGLLAALHPHIGTWIETEKETRAVLDAIPAKQLGFGPDTGHLTWAGADVISLLTDYRERIHAVHIKDCLLDVLDLNKKAGSSYRDTVIDGLWIEPGRGNLDLTAMLAALGPDFDGWLIAEVDYPALPAFECAEESARWLCALSRPAAVSA